MTCLWPLVGGTTEGCIASSVVCLRDFVVGCVLATASHGVKTGAGGEEGATVAGTVMEAGSDETQTTDVRGP